MIINIRSPKFDNTVEDGLSIIGNINELFKTKWQTPHGTKEFENHLFFNLIEYFNYFRYVDGQLEFILNNRSIISNKAKELFILRERLIRVLNPKIQLLIYSDSLNHNKTCFYAIISHLNDVGDELFSEIDLEELLPVGCDEFNLREFLTERFINSIKFKVFDYLKKTIQIPSAVDFDLELLKLSHHNEHEMYANKFCEDLLNKIENLEIDEIEKTDKNLYNQLKSIKKNSVRVSNFLNKLQVLDLSLTR